MSIATHNPYDFYGKPDPFGYWAGWVSAVDADTGALKWRLKSNFPIVSGMIPTAGEFGFLGDMGGKGGGRSRLHVDSFAHRGRDCEGGHPGSWRGPTVTAEPVVGLATHDPLERTLSAADDRVRLNEWRPPQAGVVPKIRFGRRWVSVLWALPIAFVVLVAGVALAHASRHLPSIQAFIVRCPGEAVSAHAVNSGFPAWLRPTHFLNLFFMTFIIRAGLQIVDTRSPSMRTMRAKMRMSGYCYFHEELDK